MCGRYRLKDPKAAFAWMEVVSTLDFLPRFNIAPTQRIPVVTAPGYLEAMTWGILPPWAAEKSRPLINARCETIREKRTFNTAFSQRRCLVPADGFYEWSRLEKRPHFLTVNDGAPFAIGAIWEPAGDSPRCCLLTTAANSILQPIHDRMPVIVAREHWPEWLSAAALPDASFQRITAPYNPGQMTIVSVSPLVNSARIDDPSCCDPSIRQSPPKLKITRKSSLPPDGQQTFGF